jgi:hypothetical protein
MPTGIAQTSSVRRYVESARTLIGHWSGYSKGQRAAHLMNAVHAELNRYAVPNPTIQWENLTDCGQFDFRAWQVKLSNTKWDRNPLNVTAQEQIDFKKHIAELADTVYHECRHCEQWFRMARFLAAKRTGGSRKYSKGRY